MQSKHSRLQPSKSPSNFIISLALAWLSQVPHANAVYTCTRTNPQLENVVISIPWVTVGTEIANVINLPKLVYECTEGGSPTITDDVDLDEEITLCSPELWSGDTTYAVDCSPLTETVFDTTTATDPDWSQFAVEGASDGSYAKVSVTPKGSVWFQYFLIRYYPIDDPISHGFHAWIRIRLCQLEKTSDGAVKTGLFQDDSSILNVPVYSAIQYPSFFTTWTSKNTSYVIGSGQCQSLSVATSSNSADDPNIYMEYWCGTEAGSYPDDCTTYDWFTDTDPVTGSVTFDSTQASAYLATLGSSVTDKQVFVKKSLKYKVKNSVFRSDGGATQLPDDYTIEIDSIEGSFWLRQCAYLYMADNEHILAFTASPDTLMQTVTFVGGTTTGPLGATTPEMYFKVPESTGSSDETCKLDIDYDHNLPDGQWNTLSFDDDTEQINLNFEREFALLAYATVNTKLFLMNAATDDIIRTVTHNVYVCQYENFDATAPELFSITTGGSEHQLSKLILVVGAAAKTVTVNWSDTPLGVSASLTECTGITKSITSDLGSAYASLTDSTFQVLTTSAMSGSITAVTTNTAANEQIRSITASVIVCGYDNLLADIFVESTDVFFNVLTNSYLFTVNPVDRISSQSAQSECSLTLSWLIDQTAISSSSVNYVEQVGLTGFMVTGFAPTNSWANGANSVLVNYKADFQDTSMGTADSVVFDKSVSLNFQQCSYTPAQGENSMESYAEWDIYADAGTFNTTMLTFSHQDPAGGISSGISPNIAGCRNLTYEFTTPNGEFYEYDINEDRLILTLDITPEMVDRSYLFELKYKLGEEIVASGTIKLNVNAVTVIPPSFSDTDEFEILQISAIAPFEWTLPSIDKGTAITVDLTVKPADQISSLVYFDSEKQTVHFEGSESSAQLSGVQTSIFITLTTDTGLRVVKTQVLQFNASTEQLQAATEDEIENLILEQEFLVEELQVPPVCNRNDTDACISEKGVEEVVPEEEQIVVIEKKVEIGGLNLVVPPVTKKQAALIETPVEEIPEDLLFTPVPLAARLTTGVKNVKELVLKQRQSIKDKAAGKDSNDEGSSGGALPPETRVRKFTNNGELKMGFTQPIQVPKGAEDLIKAQTEEGRRRLANGQAPGKALIQVFAVKEEVPDEDDISGSAEPIMDGWELISLDKDGFELKLNFTNPIKISGGEEPDLLLIQLDLSDFLDENGNPMPESVVKYSPIPTQIGSAAEAQQVADQGGAAGSSSKASVGSNLAVNLVMAGSLSKVWQMIEGLQVVNHMPLFKVKSPGNVNAFNEFMSEIAKFDLIDAKELTLSTGIYIPEMDAVSLNFQNAGFDTSLAIPSLGTLFYMLFTLIILVVVHIFILLLAKLWSKVSWLENKVCRYLYWNGSIRFFMEGYLDFAMFAMLNIKEMDWEDDFILVKASNIFSIIILSFTLLLPIIMCFFWATKVQQWNKDEFKAKYGSLLDGSNSESRKWYIMLVPMTYFLRRIALCICCVFFIETFWAQVALQIMVSVFVIILLHWKRPLESNYATNIETFNEIITLITLYLLMCFSDFVPDEAIRSECGKAFIATIIVFALVHFFFLFSDVCLTIRHAILKKYYARRNKRILKEMRAKKYEMKDSSISKSQLIAPANQNSSVVQIKDLVVENPAVSIKTNRAGKHRRPNKRQQEDMNPLDIFVADTTPTKIMLTKEQKAWIKEGNLPVIDEDVDDIFDTVNQPVVKSHGIELEISSDEEEKKEQAEREEIKQQVDQILDEAEQVKVEAKTQSVKEMEDEFDAIMAGQ